ncbi:transcriptional regulator SplA domain-containing protein [Ectobacillus antri]|jgi:transcriptional regulator of the spore photoproduct lyase operon|uniref:Transcriptional regulator SplA domain-containing protein n=1 Tax=Ectobacillus antri TaxID=2486280 RepID=A0ABT6H1Q2_9BACI|nr:transcriptional regulator SplA domain-containing protein [Ectobacillus antri]MDG4656245.1 transcriptional regulator SplA domain-containing protein [Ectobacillus antri]MDG5752920.1 transcriptional regulator SplA domain-containing protein [Ectobacillus antri]
MDDLIGKKDMKPGDEVFVIYNNPHTPTVANIRAAEIVQHPKDPNDVALFLYDTFHVIEDDDALFTSEQAAQQAYDQMLNERQYDTYK